MIEFITTSPIQTKKIAFVLAKEILKMPLQKSALVIALEGNLGSGKTTFTQGFAKGLGIKEIPKSPTFVIMNVYTFEKSQTTPNKLLRNLTGQANHKSQTNSKPRKQKNLKTYKHLAHIDCYRIASAKELAHLGVKEIFRDPHSVVLIEWAERIKRLLPRNIIHIRFYHGKQKHERTLQISNF